MPFVSLYALIVRKRFSFFFISDEETIRLIRNEGYSLSRFGDGEFRWIKNEKDICLFQEPSTDLSRQLRLALKSKKEKLLIGIPRALFFDKEYKIQSRIFWREYLVKNGHWLSSVLPQISIWDNRNVLIVEGEQTKFGIGNDLLDNASSINRILAPAENAFSYYSEIKNEIKKYANTNSLVLLCLGPTATILAADQDLEALQLIDIGHLDVEYEWYKARAKKKTPIKGKYVNEASSRGDLTYNEDPLYTESIISTVGLR